MAGFLRLVRWILGKFEASQLRGAIQSSWIVFGVMGKVFGFWSGAELLDHASGGYYSVMANGQPEPPLTGGGGLTWIIPMFYDLSEGTGLGYPFSGNYSVTAITKLSGGAPAHMITTKQGSDGVVAARGTAQKTQ